MRRPLLLTFTIALACGALISALLLRAPQSMQARTSTNATTLDSADNDQSADADSTDDWPDDADTPEQVLYAQAQMVAHAAAKLAPRTPGKPNLYFIGFAGDGEEDVFRNEVEYAGRLFAQRYDSAGHELLLVNNPATLKQHPLASLSNLELAIDAVAEKMDRDNDVLLVLLSSHGSSDHLLYVSMDPLPLDQIAPTDLADIFAKAHIRYKVVVISACYSGGFIDALKDDTTMIVTAARADRASFGCGTDSDITDFGRAFFVEGLNHNDTFAAAFAEAGKSIDAKETREGEKHSHPQLATTPRIDAQLKAWRSGIHLGAPVPFVPAAKTAANDTLTVSR